MERAGRVEGEKRAVFRETLVVGAADTLVGADSGVHNGTQKERWNDSYPYIINLDNFEACLHF